MPFVNHYIILELQPTATQEQIVQAYRKMSLKFHPDRSKINNMDVEYAASKFKDINEAYEVLGDSEKRSKFDDELLKQEKQKSSSNRTYMSIVRDPETSLEPLVKLKRRDIFRVFSERDSELLNILMIAVQCRPEALKPLMDKLQSLSEDLQSFILMQGVSYKNIFMMGVDKYPQSIQPLMTGLQLFSKKVQTEVLMQTDQYGQNTLMMAVTQGAVVTKQVMECLKLFSPDIVTSMLIQPNHRKNYILDLCDSNTLPLLLDYIAELKSEDKLNLLLQSKHNLSKLSESNPELLKVTLNCVAMMDIKHQETFYNAWWVSQPKLKQQGLCEVGIQKALNEFVKKAESSGNPKIVNACSALQVHFDNYRKTARHPDDLIRLYNDIRRDFDNPIIKNFLESNPNGNGHSNKFSMFFSCFFRQESNYARTAREFKSKLQALNHNVDLSPSEPFLKK